ncbi:hypothetical protein BWI15_34735 [Kribbella sp. ALI-6-A]|uniref:hypothetical protein n=1 Tax=Kribbella sp. ALI-6-A TaxID=1933817 RepID=UPI00097C3466|nr:hypothetical protein [Kribbella sp. ALI-6-A]ONI68193.1 hypothetical protein BWI15_34735 [Kribbella sp. ALI-6-A]
METEDAARIEGIAEAFRAAAPEGWESLRIRINTISSVTAFVAHATLESGAVESYYIDDDDAEEEVLDGVEGLRRQMAESNGDRGAWFSASIEVDRDGKFSAAFDYDSKPSFDFEVDHESLLADLREFPRAEKFYPPWARG